MANSVKQAGWWVKRSWLKMRMDTAPLSRKKVSNERLNYKEFWQGRTRLISRPLHLQIGTNLTCNLKCVFCRRQVPEEIERLKAIPADKREISPQTLERIIDIMPYASIVNLTPYGEPLMYSGLEEMLERHRQMGCNNLALTTNGMLLEGKWAERLVQSGLHILFLSVDSCDPDLYASMRVGGDLAKIKRGLDEVNQAKRRFNSEKPHLIFASTFMERNIPQLPDMVDFAKKHGIEEISVQLMEMENKALEPESLHYHIDLTRRMVEEAEKRARATDVRLNQHLALRNLLDTSPSSQENASSDTKSQKKKLIEQCSYPWNFLLIDTDGDVRPCCYSSVSLGNMAEKPFEELWNGKIMQRMRRDFLDNRIPAFCRDKHCRVDM